VLNYSSCLAVLGDRDNYAGLYEVWRSKSAPLVENLSGFCFTCTRIPKLITLLL